jgi:ribosome-associated toxin RatA of RatAB toxin-antitoxin module
MAKPIHSTDRVVLPHPVDEVREVLLDVGSYDEWWPPKMKVQPIRVTPDRVGSAARISYHGSKFSVRVVEYTQDRIVMEYYEGVQRGNGVWTFETLGPSETQLTYSIDLRPVGLLPSLLGHVMDYAKLHSTGMRDVYAGLREYLAEQS